MNDVDDGSSSPSGDAGARNGIAANPVELFEAALPPLTATQRMHVASTAATALLNDNRPLVAVLTNSETKSLKDIGPPADDHRQLFD
jgi:hypothetical protein